MKYRHISGKIYEATVLGQTIMVEYDGDNPEEDVTSIAVDRVLNHEHTEYRASGMKHGLFDTQTGSDEEVI